MKSQSPVYPGLLVLLTRSDHFQFLCLSLSLSLSLHIGTRHTHTTHIYISPLLSFPLLLRAWEQLSKILWECLLAKHNGWNTRAH